MKRSVKEWAVRVAILLLGLCVAHLGVTLFLLSDLTLSNKYFLKKKPKAFGAIVLVTYYAAVACIGLYLL